MKSLLKHGLVLIFSVFFPVLAQATNFSFIASATAHGPDCSTGFTTSGISTTGATFIVGVIAQAAPNALVTVTDNKGNTVSMGTPIASNNNSELIPFYERGPVSVGAGHTWSVNGGACANIAVLAFSGSGSGITWQDQSANAVGTGVTTLAAGSITPSAANELVVAFEASSSSAMPTIGGGFSSPVGSGTVSATAFGVGISYLIQTSATAANPTWTWGSSGDAVAEINSFFNFLPPACSGVSPSLTANMWDAVTNCHAIANSGDTITVTTGTYSVLTNTQITKAVTIVASGTVTLNDHTCDSNPGCSGQNTTLITFTESTAGSSRLNGFTINVSNAEHGNPGGVMFINTTSGGKPVVIQNNIMNDNLPQANGNWIYVQSHRGVISGNTFTATPGGPNCNTQVQFVQAEPGENTAAWASAVVYGSNDTNGDQNLYIETNTIKYGGLTDLLSNARVVFRHNRVVNTSVGIHGITEVNGRFLDIDTNTFVNDRTIGLGTCATDSPGNDENFNGFIRIGGGVALIHGNSIDNGNTLSWQTKPPVVFSDENLTRQGGAWPCWDKQTAPGTGHPSAEQPGWGWVSTGTILTRDPSGNPQAQSLEPIYVWGNTGAGNTPNGYDSPLLLDDDVTSPDLGGGTKGCQAAGYSPPFPTTAQYVVEGTEYYLNADAPSGKPGYTSFTYPHPLVNSGPSQSFTTQPANIVKGSNFSPPVVVTVSPAATDSLTLSITGGCGVTLSGTLTVTANASGVATFSGVGASTAATGCILNVHDNTNAMVADVSSNTFTVCGQLIYTAQPSNAAPGATLGTVSVSIEDANGVVCTSGTNSITLAAHSGATWASLSSSSSLTKAAVSGVSTWMDLSISPTTGSGSIDATATGLTTATSNSITIGSPCVPAKLAFTGQPQNSTFGVSVGTISVAVEDSGGNVCNDTSTITLSIHPGSCIGMTLNGTVSGSAVAGTFSTSNVNMTVATGACQLDAADGALTGATSAIFNILSSTANASQLKPKIIRRKSRRD